MDLLLRVSSPESLPVDVRAILESTHTTDDLASALAAYCGLQGRGWNLAVTRSITAEALPPDSRVAEIGLVSGDNVVLHSRALPDAAPSEPGGLRLAVTSGADAGLSHSLGLGRHFVGRSSRCEIPVDDPLISRRHFALLVASDSDVRLAPNPDAANGLRLNGVLVTEEAAIALNDVIQVGSTSFTLRASKVEPPRVLDAFGNIAFHRTPYFRHPVAEQVFDALGDLPVKPEPRKFQYLGAIAPIFMGLAMAFMMNNMRFMLFAIMSPVMAVGTWLDQRKQTGEKYDRKVIRFKERLKERVEEIDAALVDERRRRFANAPDVEMLAHRAENRLNELWVRGREADDFLSLRVGVGTVVPSVVLKPDTQGDDEFREELAEAVAHATEMIDVPLTVLLAELGTIGLVGDHQEVTSLAAALALQACCLHSPEDLVVMSAVAHDRGMNEWLKWLPHTRSSSSPLGGRHLVGDADEASTLLRELAKIAEERAAHQERDIDRRWPWLVVFVDRLLEPEPGTASRLLDLCPEVGISVVWLTDTDQRVPRQANAVVQCEGAATGRQSEVRFTDPDMPNQRFDADRVRGSVADAAGRALAPMRDASAANAATAIPRIVTLFESMGVDEVTPEWIAEQWMTDRGYSLVAPIGMTDTGPVTLDLVEHGPHGLIGGTSGAGKSELVQSLVSNLIAFNSPERINFLFVDYKGGALSELFKDVPHTVGAVTNLDALLALRALTSLTAELDRRMELFKGRATDIKEMLAKFPEEAPPSLVIVVDEFAALVRELPEFVEGIVSIAERGRSLGIHLLLSTQRPSGSINENIQQNTNLRISLRMLDSGESNNVIGTPDAAMIPGPLKGRGFARLGPGELVPFQSAWSGAPVMTAAGPPPVKAVPFTTLPAGAVPAVRSSGSAAPAANNEPELTQLDAVLAATLDAAKALNMKRGRAPWQETLPNVIGIRGVLADERSAAVDIPGRVVTLGMIDDPAAQDQYPAHVDLEDGGTVAVFGNGGSGKTTLLRTVALSAAIRDSERGGGTLSIFGLDFASRELGLLSRLPQCESVAMGDDLEGVTRTITLLESQLDRRRAAAADAAASGNEPPRYTRILFLIDGYENMAQLFETSRPGQNLQAWLDRVTRIIADGRQVGINTVFTAGRRSAVRSAVMSSVSNRLVLRQSDESSYMELGLPSKMAKGLDLRPGQAFNQDNQMLQIAALVSDDDPSVVDERDALISLAAALKGQVAPELISPALPAELSLRQLLDSDTVERAARTVRIGITDMTLAPVTLDLTHNNVVVLGPPRSGRSTTLFGIAEQVAAQGTEIWVVGTPGSKMAAFGKAEQSAFGRPADVTPLLEEMATAVESFPDVERMLIFDDVDMIDDRPMHAPMTTIIESGVRVVGSVASLKGFGQNPLYQELKNARSVLFLQPEGPREVQESVGLLPPMRPGLRMAPGRGVLIVDRIPGIVQVASHEIDSAEPLIRPSSDLTELAETSSPVEATAADSVEASAPNADAESPDRLVARVVDGPAFVLDQPVHVGRRSLADWDGAAALLADTRVSGDHAAFLLVDGQPCIVDRHSRNGTRIERGELVVEVCSEPVAVQPGDAVLVGRTRIEVLAG